jgi:hypothetical protein
MIPKIKTNTNKHCPLINNECMRNDCMLYHEKFDKCYIDLLALNVYSLTAEIKKMNNTQN